jgi:hypothetical protein
MAPLATSRKRVGGPLRTLSGTQSGPHTGAGATCKAFQYTQLQSGRPDSNRRRPAWEAGILPTELRPRRPLSRPPILRLPSWKINGAVRSRHRNMPTRQDAGVASRLASFAPDNTLRYTGGCHCVAPRTVSFHKDLMRTSIIALALVCACASASRPATESRSNDRILGVDDRSLEVIHTQASVGAVTTSIHAPLSAVWTALPQVYAALGIELTLIDQPSGTIGNRSFIRTRTLAGKRMSSFFDCGSSMTGMRADEGRMIASAVSKVTAGADGQTSLATTVSGAVQTNEGASAQTIPCASTGMLEEAIRSAVARRTGGT